MLWGEIVLCRCLIQHAIKTGQPLLARRFVDYKRHMAGAHHWVAIALMIEGRTTQQPDKEGG